MNNMILAITLVEWLSNWYHILAVALLALGLSLFLVSMKLTACIRKNNQINNKDKLLVTFRIVSLVIFLAGLVLFCLPPTGFKF